MFWREKDIPFKGLYRQEFEHDNCGIGAVVNMKGKKSRATVENALKIVENLEHRAGKDAEGKTGDGVGILVQIPHKFFQKAVYFCYFASFFVVFSMSLQDFKFRRDLNGIKRGVGIFLFPEE